MPWKAVVQFTATATSVQAFLVLAGLTVDKITTLFQFPTLPTTKYKPTYVHTIDVRNKMYRDLVAVKSSFMPASPYRTQAGED